ncbi:hypothetical protein [uncultured Dialister sp.]|uniref:hypothetical protein n=1 Tax=uncultured Dialister sp. TaxID=278064 RepID=UPI0026DD90FF|nr:hypothetical protein [uncultured Dialister sp.]
MLIVRIKNYIFKDPRSIRVDRVTLGDCELAGMFVKDCSGREMYFTIPNTEGVTNRDIFRMAAAIGREIARKCAESPLPHVVINLDKVLADFWMNR